MSRYGIAEWYGQPFLTLAPGQRRAFADAASGIGAPPPCPFRPGTACNKPGGVCTLQSYREDTGRIGGSEGDPVIICPSRFEQGELLVRWLAAIVPFVEGEALVAREVPFMRSTQTGKPAGKIDLVIASTRRDELRWFGLEIQAVYFSGAGMNQEFEALRDDGGDPPPFPVGVRRPDWRSSSAKRLMPQLQIKTPTLRRWHSKIAVAVDRPFFASLGGPSAEPSHDLDSGDVIWLVPAIRNGVLTRGHWEVLTLEASEEKLQAARTVTRTAFEGDLRARLRPLRGRR